MSTEQLEERLATVEKALADLQQKVDSLPVNPPPKAWWETMGRTMTPEEQKDFELVIEYGKFYRKTGREAPPDWKPGDPYPEPIEGWVG